MDIGIPVSKGQLTTGGFAGVLLAIARSDQANAFKYAIMATVLFVVYRLTDVALRIWGGSTSSADSTETTLG